MSKSFIRKDIVATMEKIEEIVLDDIKSKNGEVLNVKYLDNISVSKEVKDKTLAIYKCQLKENDKLVERYYAKNLSTGKLEWIAGDNLNDLYEKTYLRSDFKGDEETKKYLEDEINKLSKEGLMDLEIERRLEKTAKTLGIDNDEIRSAIEINLNQSVKKDQNNIQKPNNMQENDEKKHVSGLQNINIDAKFNNVTSLRYELGLDEDCKSLMVVYSDSIRDWQEKNGEVNNSRYSVVQLKNDGSIKPVSSLVLDTTAGTTPNKAAMKSKNDEVMKEDRKTKTRFKVPGKNMYMSFQIGQYGEIEAFCGGKNLSENEYVESQLETSSLRPTPQRMREMQNSRKGLDNYEDRYNEARDKMKNGEVKGVKNFDGDEESFNDEDGVDRTTRSKNDVIESIVNELDEDKEIDFKTHEIKRMVENYINNKKIDINGLNQEKFEKLKHDIKISMERDSMFCDDFYGGVPKGM